MDKNRLIFDEGFSYLLELPGINREIILRHLHEWENRKPKEINGENGLYYKMIEHAQNRRDMPRTIGNIDDLNEILFKFNPKLVLTEYNSTEKPWKKLLIKIHTEYPLKNINIENEKSYWVHFSKSIISIANFLSKFSTIDEFNEFADLFNKTDDTRIALALLLEREISGYGFALACDFLKENYSPQYAKPDTHIKGIFKGLSLSVIKDTTKDEDIEIFRDVIKYSRSINELPYEVDRLFWLIGSGDFYLFTDLPEYKENKKKASKGEFIQRVRNLIDLNYGVF
jgi:hypothetical protein